MTTPAGNELLLTSMSRKAIIAERGKESTQEKASLASARRAAEKAFMHVRDAKPAWTDTYISLST
jgi:hypothetical protein